MAIIDLNIGLVTSEDSGKRELRIEPVVHAVERAGFQGVAYTTASSDSEETAVITAKVESDWTLDELREVVHGLCVDLKQDAIAGRLAGHGFLVGPKAAEWGGKFIEEYYLKP